jgi:hypothetical protein
MMKDLDPSRIGTSERFRYGSQQSWGRAAGSATARATEPLRLTPVTSNIKQFCYSKERRKNVNKNEHLEGELGSGV